MRLFFIFFMTLIPPNFKLGRVFGGYRAYVLVVRTDQVCAYFFLTLVPPDFKLGKVFGGYRVSVA